MHKSNANENDDGKTLIEGQSEILDCIKNVNHL